MKAKTANRSPKQWARLVCIVGIDGSGKTTLARAVIEEIGKLGVTYNYAWGNAQPILMYPIRWIARRSFLHKRDMFRDYQGYKNAKESLVRGNFFTKWLYISVLLSDYFFWLMSRVTVPRFFGQKIVCDRYVFDVAINVGLLLGWSVEKMQNWLDTLWRLFPQPDFLFWIDVPVKVAFSRKTDVPSADYLEERSGVYKELLQPYNPIVLDGTQVLPDIVQIVIDTLRRDEGEK